MCSDQWVTQAGTKIALLRLWTNMGTIAHRYKKRCRLLRDIIENIQDKNKSQLAQKKATKISS